MPGMPTVVATVTVIEFVITDKQLPEVTVLL